MYNPIGIIRKLKNDSFLWLVDRECDIFGSAIRLVPKSTMKSHNIGFLIFIMFDYAALLSFPFSSHSIGHP